MIYILYPNGGISKQPWFVLIPTFNRCIEPWTLFLVSIADCNVALLKRKGHVESKCKKPGAGWDNASFRVKSATCFSSWFNNVPINATLGLQPRGWWQTYLKSSLSDCINDSTAVLSPTVKQHSGLMAVASGKHRHQLLLKESNLCAG